MLLAGVKCDKCSRTEIIRYENEEVLKILYQTKGWVFRSNTILCPFCVTKEIANHMNNEGVLLSK